jgi:acylphosphatase
VSAETASGSVTRLHAIVRGEVQGVGYRYWIHHTAERFGGRVTGRVHNLPDGAVEVHAESAERDLLEAILVEMHQGPHTAHVTGVDADWQENVPPTFSGAFHVS